MSDLSEYYRHNCESVHRSLFQLHDAIYFKALKRVEEGLKALHALERRSLDYRPMVRRRIAKLESLRDALERVGRDAGNWRTDLIGEDGCDASCHGTRDSGVSTDQ